MALWIQAQADEAIYISAITVGEIRYGAERQRRTQPAFAELLERWLEYLEAWFHDRILPFEERAANRWGLLHAQLGYSNADLQIAAHRDTPRNDCSNPERPGLRTHRSDRPQPVRGTGLNSLNLDGRLHEGPGGNADSPALPGGWRKRCRCFRSPVAYSKARTRAGVRYRQTVPGRGFAQRMGVTINSSCTALSF